MSAPSVQMVKPAPAASLGLVLALALACGAAVSLLAFLLARYGPAAGGWSFRGNGALAAYALAPALAAAGWTAVVLRYRGRPWLALAVAAAVVGALLAVADAALGPVFGVRTDQTLGPILLVLLATWTVAAPFAAAFVRVGGAGERESLPVSVAAALLWLGGLLAGLAGMGFVVPAGS